MNREISSAVIPALHVSPFHFRGTWTNGGSDEASGTSRTRANLSFSTSISLHLGQLSFFFGGTEHARTPAEWVEANIDSIRINCVLTGPTGSRHLVFCAVLVTQDSIRVIPESVLLDRFALLSAKAKIAD